MVFITKNKTNKKPCSGNIIIGDLFKSLAPSRNLQDTYLLQCKSYLFVSLVNLRNEITENFQQKCFPDQKKTNKKTLQRQHDSCRFIQESCPFKKSTNPYLLQHKSYLICLTSKFKNAITEDFPTQWFSSHKTNKIKTLQRQHNFWGVLFKSHAPS